MATHSVFWPSEFHGICMGRPGGSDCMHLVVEWRMVNKRKVQVKFNPKDFHMCHIILRPLIEYFSLTLYTKLVDWFISYLILYLLGRCKALDKRVLVFSDFI